MQIFDIVAENIHRICKSILLYYERESESIFRLKSLIPL